MGTLAVRLLGSFSAVVAEQDIPGLKRRRRQELFAFLLLNSGRRHPRELVADALWGETDNGHARKYLRQGLWQLQSALRTLGRGSHWRLDVDSRWVCLVASDDLWLDTTALEASYHAARGIALQDVDVPTHRAPREAADWCLQERVRLDAVNVAILEKPIVLAELHGNYESGLDYGARILRRDRAGEQTHRRMMRLHYLRGDRTAAPRQFQSCAAALDEEFGVALARGTIALDEQIRADRGLAVPAGSPVAPIGSAVDLTAGIFA